MLNKIEKKKILLICTYFFPDTDVAAVRLSNFAINLKKMGHDVIVLASGDINMTYDENLYKKIEGINVIFVNNNFKKNNITKNCKFFEYILYAASRCFNKLFPTLMTYWIFFRERYSVKSHYLLMKNNFNEITDKNFDVIFSTYNRIENILVAEYASKVCRCPYIADFRDNIYQHNEPLIIRHYNNKLETKVVAKADACTCVTDVANKLLLRHNVNNYVYTLRNGYEPIKIDKRQHDKFTLCFTGNLIYKFQSFDIIFKALAELINDKCIERNNVKFFHAGVASKRFIRSAKKYNLLNITEDFGFCNSQKVADIQASSDIFVNILWNRDEYSSGNIGGKFYEGIKNELPILCIILGKGENAELAMLNDKYHYGFCYQEGNGKKDYLALKEWIVDCYNKKMNGEPIIKNYPQNLKDDFSYPTLTKQLDKIMDITIDNYKNKVTFN